METATIANLILCIACVIGAIAGVVIALTFGAWWNLAIGALFGILAYANYVDDDHGDCMSVKTYVGRIIKNLKNQAL